MKRPFLFFTISLIVGIWFFYTVSININVNGLLIASIIIVIGLISIFLMKFKNSFALFLIFFLLGGYITAYNVSCSELDKFQGKYLTLAGTVKDVLVKSDNYSKYIVQVKKINYFQTYYKTDEKMILKISGVKKFSIGDQISVSGIIEVPRKNGNPKLFNYKLYMQIEKIYTEITAKDYMVDIISTDDLSMIEKISVKFKENIVGIFDKYLDKESSSIIKSIILGDSRFLEEDYVNQIRDLGLAHILAVSGLHIGIISMFLERILRLLRFNRKISAIIIIILLWSYGYVVGYPSSVLRALIMFSCLAMSNLTYRRYDPVNSLAFGGFLLLLYNPLWVFDVGFQLSFTATLSIVLFTNRINNLFFRRRIIGNVFSPVIAVQIGILPVLAYHFNQIPILSVLANIIVIPIMSLSVVIGFVLLAVSVVSMKISIIAGNIVNLLLHISNFLMILINKSPIVTINVFSPTLIEVVGYFTVVFMLLKKNRFDKIPLKIKKLIFVYMLIIISVTGFIRSDREEIKIEFLDVGQGDSCLITYDNKAILIDTGGSVYGDFDTGTSIVIPYLLKNRINKLNAVVITHFHEDHCEGLLSVMNCIDIDTIITGYTPERNELYKRIKINAEIDNIPIKVLDRGDRLLITDNVYFDVLWPISELQNNYIYSENNSSLVLLLNAYGRTVLFTGDIEKEVEEYLINNNGRQNIDIFKIPHHGSNTSSSIKFIKHFTPDYGVISLGRNNFGHPDREVIDRYLQNNTVIYRTDKDGLVTVVISPESIEIYPYHGCNSTVVDIINKDRMEIMYFIMYIGIGLLFMKLYSDCIIDMRFIRD